MVSFETGDGDMDTSYRMVNKIRVALGRNFDRFDEDWE